MDELRAKAIALVDREVTTPNLKKHLLAVEALMRALARRFGENEDAWGIAGLVHDMDWDKTEPTPEKHGLAAGELLEREGFPAEIVRAVRAHNPMTGVAAETRMEKALYYTEEITGLIVANALVLPSKKLADVTVESVLKKMKEKSFARGVNRDIIREGPQHLGMTLEEIIQTALTAMQGISGELGL